METFVSINHFGGDLILKKATNIFFLKDSIIPSDKPIDESKQLDVSKILLDIGLNLDFSKKETIVICEAFSFQIEKREFNTRIIILKNNAVVCRLVPISEMIYTPTMMKIPGTEFYIDVWETNGWNSIVHAIQLEEVES